MASLLRHSMFICLIILQIAVTHTDGEKLPRIAIVGAGVGGTSSAYFLRQLFGDDAEIDVYEANKVGGRAALVEFSGYEYEAGAVAIFKRNRYMFEFNKLLREDGLYRKFQQVKFGIYGNDGFVFQGSDSNVLTLLGLIYRYGSDLYKIQDWTQNSIVPAFERIYALQEQEIAYTSCRSLLGAMGEDLVELTGKTVRQALLDIGVSQLIIDELVMGIMKDNYGQTTDVHGFVGAISLIGTTAEIWSVIDGNKNIPELLLKDSKANLINGTVTKVTLVEGENNSTFKLDYVTKDAGETATQTGSKEYDIVILATPLNGTKNKIKFVNFPNPVADFTQEYHRTVTLFVKDGEINKTTFNLKKESDFPPVIYLKDDDFFYDHLVLQPSSDNAINSYTDDCNSSSIWEVYASRLPNQEEFRELFEGSTATKHVDWLAYPEYTANMELPTFVLSERLYYLNAIESAASAMEMSAVGGKNMALLAYNQWYGRTDKIDKDTIEPSV